eukprot:gene17490-35993_t
MGVLLALLMRHGRGIGWVRAGLVLSTAYLGWSVAAQQMAIQQFLAHAPVPQLAPGKLLVTPAPFSTLLWR